MEFIPEGTTVNKHRYKEIINRLRYSIHRKRPELWCRKNWLLLHYNAPAHRSVFVQEGLAKQQVTVLPHPPYSPDLASCNFFFFPRLTEKLHGRRFLSSLPQGKPYRTFLKIAFSSVSSNYTNVGRLE
jgi:histone-lysine N-methyltransferase SETMAR